MHSKKSHTSEQLIDFSILSMLTFAFILLGDVTAFAAPPTSPAGSGVVQLCDGIGKLWGDIGRGVSTLGVIGIAIMACFGRVTWGQAVLVAVGIAAVNAAGVIAGYFMNGGQGCLMTSA